MFSFLSHAPRPLALIVEDDPGLSLTMTLVLHELGFKTLEVPTGEAGLLKLRQTPDINLVLADICMPGAIDGLELAAYAREDRPDLNLLLTSGQSRPTHRDLPSRVRFLSKPFTLGQLEAELNAFAEANQYFPVVGQKSSVNHQFRAAELQSN